MYGWWDQSGLPQSKQGCFSSWFSWFCHAQLSRALTIPFPLQDSSKQKEKEQVLIQLHIQPLFSGEPARILCTSDSDDGSGGGSASEDGSESEGEGEAGSDGGASDSRGSSDHESSGSSRSGSEGATEDEGAQQDSLDNEGERSGSEIEGSDAGGSSSSSESVNAGSQPKVTPPAKKALEVNLNTSQMPSPPNLDSKDSDKEW